MIENIYNKILDISKKKYALSFLLFIAFIESFIFPIPPDIFLIFLILAQRNKAFYFAFYCTLFSVLGGMLGFAIGVFFFDTIGSNILNYYNLDDKFLNFKNYYNEFGIWVVAAGGFTPIPYKVITIFSGFIKMNFIEFTIASFISRAARYFLLATLLYFYGKKFENYLNWLENESLVIIQIENIKAIENIDEIFATKGIDAFLIGPYDLSGSMNKPGDFDDKEFKEKLSDSNLNIDENIEIIHAIGEANQLGIFHASAPTTRGCLSTDDGWIGALLKACSDTGKLKYVLVEIFHHEDEALEPLRSLVEGHGVDSTDGRNYDELMLDGVVDITRRLNNLVARNIL